MTGNRFQSPLHLKRKKFSWDQFDSLPRDVRDALNYATFRYGADKNCTAADIIAHDTKAVATAYEQREALDDLKDLGL